jgi:hypothetical protein
MFVSSLPPVVCRGAHVLFTLCSLRLYLQLFIGELMSYLRCSVCLYLQLFVGALISYLRCSVCLYLQLFVGGLMSYLCFVFVLFVFVLCSYPMLQVSLDCSFCIAFSVFSNAYLNSSFSIIFLS